MRFASKFGLPLIAALALLAAAITPLANNLLSQWFQRDLQLRSQLIFTTIAPAIERLVASGSVEEIATLFDDVAKDERVLTLAWCDAAGVMRVQSGIPLTERCPVLRKSLEFRVAQERGKQGLLAIFPLSTPDAAAGH